MDNTHRLYETTFIVNASLDDPQVDAVVARVQDTITKNGGTIKAVNKWGRKRLSYPINKKTNGFYVNIEFTVAGSRADRSRAVIPARRDDPAAPHDRRSTSGPSRPARPPPPQQQPSLLRAGCSPCTGP